MSDVLPDPSPWGVLVDLTRIEDGILSGDRHLMRQVSEFNEVARALAQDPERDLGRSLAEAAAKAHEHLTHDDDVLRTAIGLWSDAKDDLIAMADTVFMDADPGRPDSYEGSSAAHAFAAVADSRYMNTIGSDLEHLVLQLPRDGAQVRESMSYLAWRLGFQRGSWDPWDLDPQPLRHHYNVVGGFFLVAERARSAIAAVLAHMSLFAGAAGHEGVVWPVADLRAGVRDSADIVDSIDVDITLRLTSWYEPDYSDVVSRELERLAREYDSRAVLWRPTDSLESWAELGEMLHPITACLVDLKSKAESVMRKWHAIREEVDGFLAEVRSVEGMDEETGVAWLAFLEVKRGEWCIDDRGTRSVPEAGAFFVRFETHSWNLDTVDRLTPDTVERIRQWAVQVDEIVASRPPKAIQAFEAALARINDQILPLLTGLDQSRSSLQPGEGSSSST